MESVNYNIGKSNQISQYIQGLIQILQELTQVFPLTTAGFQLGSALTPRGDAAL